jgi:hypothetical protein
MSEAKGYAEGGRFFEVHPGFPSHGGMMVKINR